MEAFNNYYGFSSEKETQTNLLQPQNQLKLGKPERVGIGSAEIEITSWLAGLKPAGKASTLSPEAWKDQVRFNLALGGLHTDPLQ